MAKLLMGLVLVHYTEPPTRPISVGIFAPKLPGSRRLWGVKSKKEGEEEKW